MPFYLLLVLGWCGAAAVAALSMGRFIAAGSGKLGPHIERAAPGEPVKRGRSKTDAAPSPRGTREAA